MKPCLADIVFWTNSVRNFVSYGNALAPLEKSRLSSDGQYLLDCSLPTVPFRSYYYFKYVCALHSILSNGSTGTRSKRVHKRAGELHATDKRV
jgi:hypothetical protein